MSVLDTFRENANLQIEEIEPQIFLPTGPSGIQRADIVGNNAYFNNLSVIGDPQTGANNSITTNFITPQSNPAYNGDWHLGIYGIADGTAPHAVVFDLYESILNPGVGPQNGEQFTKLSICSTPPSGPFLITTNWSVTGGQVRGILVAPGGVLQLGSNTTARWDIQTSSGNLVPSQGQTVNIGMPGNPNGPVADIYAFGFHVVSWGWQEVGSLQWNQTVTQPILTLGVSQTAQAGIIRMANNVSMGWRNGTNAGDILLGFDNNNRLSLNGVAVAGNPGTAFSGAITVVVNGVARQVPYV